MEHLEQLKEVLFTDCFTEIEALHRLRVVRQYLEYYFFMKKEGRSFVEETGLDEGDKAFAAVIHPYIALFSSETFYPVLEALKRHIATYPRLILTVPVLLEQQEENRLGQWARKHVDPKVLIVFTVDPSITTGCGITWNMKHVEYTIHQRLTEIRKELLNKIQSYA
jgi:F0F1-type ATP synthase delta subunit